MLCLVRQLSTKILTNIQIKMKDYIIKDKNGTEIQEGMKFKFKFLKELHEKPLELIGSFDWNDNELRYEIDIHDHDEYVCLSYVSNGVMRDFELLL